MIFPKCDRSRPKNADDVSIGFFDNPAISMITCLLLALFILWVALFVRVTAPVLFGGDEGFETARIDLYHRGYLPVRDYWCDQPGLYPVICGELMRVFGDGIGVARFFTVFMSCAGIWAFGSLVRLVSGKPTAIVGVAIIATTHSYIIYSLPAMVEMPAVCGSVIALSAFARGVITKKLWLVIAAGLGCGLWMHLKLTAFVYMPAGLLWATIKFRDKTLGLAASAGFLGAALIGWVIVGTFLSDMDARQLLGSHFSSIYHRRSPQFEGHSLKRALIESTPFYLAGALSILVSLFKPWPLLLPLLMLGISATALILQKPFWNYYVLHLIFPVCWLQASSISTLLQRIVLDYGAITARLTKCVSASALFVLSFLVSLDRYIGVPAAIKRVKTSDSDSSEYIVDRIKSLSSPSDTVFLYPSQICAHFAHRHTPLAFGGGATLKSMAMGVHPLSAWPELLRRDNVDLLVLDLNVFQDVVTWGLLMKDYRIAESSGKMCFMRRVQVQ